MKRLLKYLKSYKAACFIGSGFKLIEAVFELIVPLVVAAIINNGIAYSNEKYVWKMAIVLFILAGLGMCFSITAQYFSAKAAVGFGKNVREALFSNIQKLSFSELDHVGTSTLITRITSDINQVQNGVNLSLRLLLRSPFIVFGAMIMAFTVDVRSAVVFTVVIPLLFIVVFVLMLTGIKKYKEVQKRLDLLLNSTRENLKGIRVLRAFCREKSEVEEFKGYNRDFTNGQLHSGIFMAMMNPVTLVIVNFAIIFIIKSGSGSVNSGRLLQGDVVALINYMSQILVELLKFANLIITLSKSFAGADRIADFLDNTCNNNDNVESVDFKEVKNVFEVKDLSFTYDESDTPALHLVSFDVKEGETIGIIGGTGSGKTTLINLLSGFYKPSKGKIIYRGNDINKYTNEKLMSDISVVMQKAVLFSGTIRENLRWGKWDAHESVLDDALNIAQADFAFNKGLDYSVEQEGSNFSGGQKQRLSIARALVANPEVLILDDSFSALDFLTERSLYDAIMKKRNNKENIIISQRVSSVIRADKILVLEDGEAVGFDSHERLLNNCKIYQEIYYAQFPKEDEVKNNA